jgi:hypothetical protein
MNGVALLLTLASLGPIFSSRTGLDQQLEYVLQIEPEIVPLLSAGEEIFSDVPADAGAFQRLCITVLPKDGAPARHTAVGEEQFRNLLLAAGRYASRERTPLSVDAQPMILWPARAGTSPEQTSGVTTGWQPDAKGNQQYYVQIDPTVLGALAIGDELYVPVDPAAGRLVRFIVKAGREPLPHVGGQGAGAALQNPFGPIPPSATGGRSRYTGLSDSGTTTWNNSPAAEQPRRPSRFGGAMSEAPPNYPGYNPTPPASNVDQYRSPAFTGAETTSPLGYGVPPVANQQPQLPSGQRQFPSQYPETRVAGLPPVPVAGTTNSGLNPGVLSPAAVAQQQQDKPWGPLLFVTFALFFSIGGNLYLAYTALEFHSRYRNAIERLRSAARSA